MLDSVLVVGHALVGRQDLPIPEWLFAWGASVVLIVSFVTLTLTWHRSRFEQDRWRPLHPRLSRLVVNPATEVLAGAFGVLLLGVVVWSGLEGTEAPDRNFSITFVFVTAWLGLVVASVLLGDVFRAFNPWRAVARAAGGVFRLVAGQSPPPPLRYPEAAWPLARGRRHRRLRLAGAGLRPERRRDGRTDPAHRRRRHARLHGLHVRRHGPVRQRGLAGPGRVVLGLLRHVLPPRPVRGARSRARACGGFLPGRGRGRACPARSPWCW